MANKALEKVTRGEVRVVVVALVLSVIGSIYYISRGGPNPVKSNMPQSAEEIRVNMELMGYENTQFGPVVKMMGNVLGPCLTFSTTYKGSVLKGGYCTPEYSLDKWGPVIMDRQVDNMKELVDGSYRK